LLTSWTVILIALAYVGVLFAVASYGDRKIRDSFGSHGSPRPLIYALSLAVYCTSWTFFGSVGLSARTGYDFLPIYIGPILMFALGWPVLRMIVRISKRQNITSIADFISARYGKNQWLGALVALIAVVGITPYISLQLKAIAVSLHTILPQTSSLADATSGSGDNFALLVTAALAGFAMLFGTRHIDTTEHQDGLILAIAVESVIKLGTFLIVGVFVTFWVLDGFDGLFKTLADRPEIGKLFSGQINAGRWLTMTILSSFAIFLLPRQFHVAVVENTALEDVKRAAWLFPVYLVVINLFVAPIAIAGLAAFPAGSVDGDSFVLALPVESGHRFVVLAAFIGGLSAATAMVIVETIALSIMVCNNLVVPLILRRRSLIEPSNGEIGPFLLMIRRTAIVVVLALAYGYYQMISASEALAQIGLLSFAAAAQFAPAFFVGLIWKRGTSTGAMAGMLTGFIIWTYTLALPLFADAGWLPASFIDSGLFGIDLLKPRALFGSELEPLTHGVLWSLSVNLLVYISVSYLRQLHPLEAAQASVFVMSDLPTTAPTLRASRSTVSIGKLQQTVARYLGKERTKRSFDDYAAGRGLILNPSLEADAPIMRFTEHLLARAVGSSSSRLVLALLMESHTQNSKQAARLLDDASDALRHNRDLLQSAIDHVRQGIAVFDNELNLICWNRQFRVLLGLPTNLGRVGIPLSDLLRQILTKEGVRGEALDKEVGKRITRLAVEHKPYQEWLYDRSMALDVSSSKMPDGGVVVTFADITETVDAQGALVQANETLERRVEERTAELMTTNTQLELAKAEAEAANVGKTRFVAAASHDILQPLNAAKLFASSLVERMSGQENEKLVRNVDASLEAVEEILNALLEISKLDAGAMKADFSEFPLSNIFDPLRTEMTALAEAKQLELTILPTKYFVRSDRRLLRRQVQNLVSNAVKYTQDGRILVGCRKIGNDIRIDVIDTGPGIPGDKQELIFQEFTRLEKPGINEHGLGLGLSIVRRIAKVLGHDLSVRSIPGKGSRFSIRLPLATSNVVAVTPPKPKKPVAFSLGALTVMVIDNDQSIIHGMTTLLSGWGCRVISATNPDQARKLLASRSLSVDVVLADYHLDDSNGLDLIGLLQEDAGYKIPSVLITADRSQAVIEQTQTRLIGYLRKPVKPAGLRAAIAHALSHAQAAE
jgi:Na+/proline symporter/signal transduction histidine kinase/ActR/RegA family two-component response regulator